MDTTYVIYSYFFCEAGTKFLGVVILNKLYNQRE
jgi:hypothetical protein